MEDGIALYIHWPFCVSKCPYCDFNSHVRETVDQDLWLDALLRDMQHEAEHTSGRMLTSIFFGGGTPSLMPSSTVQVLIEMAQKHWNFEDDIEITLEANPSSIEAERFADLATAGVNRVSLGLQSLEDEALRFLGRAHSVSEGLEALETAQQAFERVSFDLIYALPGQSTGAWKAQLHRALGFGTNHLSLYQLTIEPGTRFATLAANGSLQPVDSDYGAALYELTQDIAGAAGLPAYEISNHARPGQESRHNLTYWRYGQYLGIGPGAHGRRNNAATTRHKKPENWIGAVERNGHGVQSMTALSAYERSLEAVMMGLRLREGVDVTLLPADIIGETAYGHLTKNDMLEKVGTNLRTTPQGQLVLDALLAELISPEIVTA